MPQKTENVRCQRTEMTEQDQRREEDRKRSRFKLLAQIFDTGSLNGQPYGVFYFHSLTLNKDQINGMTNIFIGNI